MKNFRSIRRGIGQVVRDIEAGTFGSAYRGSSLETVVGSIAEQRQIFRGADHAFLWKPKLRIPDIYEHAANQRAFAHLLYTCDCCDTAEAVVAAIHRIDTLDIKGLGPAVANLLYFIHPTLVSPFNTAIVNGFNAVTGSNVKLGRWSHYLSMREQLIRLNESHRTQLSNDLGAIAALTFDIGSGRYQAPPRENDEATLAIWQAESSRVQEEPVLVQKRIAAQRESDTTHTQVQGWLRDLGLALGIDVWIAAIDQSRMYNGARLQQGCLDALPHNGVGAQINSVRLIDVVWVDRGTAAVAAAFEVEHSTTIYSGIVRMLDLALSVERDTPMTLFLVAPDARRGEVAAQLQRPAFSRVTELGFRYLPYSELQNHREVMARFGAGLQPLLAASQRL